VTFNPNRPRALGLEWYPNGVGQSPLYGDGDQVTLRIDSNATETIDHLRVGHFWSGPTNASRRLWADVYPANAFGGDDVEVTNTFVPNETTYNTTLISTAPMWRGTTDNGATYTGGTTNSHTFVDDASDIDWLIMTVTDPSSNPESSAAGKALGLRFTAGAMPTGRRVLGVYFDIRGKRAGSTPPQISRLEMWKTGTRIGTLANVTFPSTDETTGWPTTTVGPFYLNPETQLPWTITDVQAWDTTYEMRLAITPTGFMLSGVTMRVVSVPERRVAWGYGTPERFKTTGVEWANEEQRTDVVVSLQSNDTPGSNWSKTTGTAYVITLRRMGYFDVSGQQVTIGTPAVRWIRSASGNPNVDGQVYAATMTTDGRLRSLVYGSGLASPIWLVRTDNAASVDSQPYQDIDFVPVQTTTGFVARQTVVPDDARTYATVRAIVGYQPGAEPTQPLQARLLRVSDSTVMGAPGQITFAEYIDLPQTTWANSVVSNMRMAEVIIQLATPGTLAAGTTYYLEFLSTTAATAPWYVLSLRHDAPTGVTGDVSSPGTGTTAGSGSGDLAAIVLDRPAPPGTISATNNPETITAPAGLTCNVGTAPRVDVAWSSTTLAGLFQSYEVERNDDGVWRVVRRVAAESTVSWSDREMAGNTSVQYRVRVLRNDGGRSAYALATAVVPVQAVGALRLSSNALQRTVVVEKLTPQNAWTFPTSNGAQLRELYNRDLAVIVRETEKRGVITDVPVLIWGNPTAEHPSGTGRRAFIPLRGIVEDYTTPYVAVLDDEGDRIYGHVSLPQPASRNRQAHLYLATLHVVETSFIPAVVES
jgi:hypothetical protein